MGIGRLISPDLIGRITAGPSGVAALARSNTATLTATTTLDHTSACLQILDPGGASRNLVFHTEGQSKNIEVVVRNTADAAENLVCKASDGSTTFLTIGQNEVGHCYCDGTTWAGWAEPSGSGAGAYLLADGTVTGATSQAQPLTNGITAAPALVAAGDAINVAETINHATATVEGLDVTVSAITTARTGGEVVGEKITVVGTATDTAGASFVALDLNATDTAGSGVFTGIKLDAGFDVLIDVSEAATGEADIVVGDNKASALQIREGANAYLDIVTTDGSEAVKVSKALDVDNALDLDHALTAAGDLANVAGTINHATADAEGVDVSLTQLTTARTSGTVAAVKASTTSLAGDTGGNYAGIHVTHTDGGGTAVHIGVLVDGTSDVALGSVNSTAGGASAATAAVVSKTGNRIKNDADAGVPGSGNYTSRSGDSTVTAAAVGGPSGSYTARSGDTDCTNAGGTGGATGAFVARSGHASSTLGTSGPTGDATLQSGNSADGASGNVLIQAGTAGTTQGVVRVASGLAFDVNIPTDQDVALTAAGDALNVAVTINEATANVEGIDASFTAITTARTGGTASVIKASATGLAGDTAGATVNGFEAAAPVANGGSAIYNAIKVGAGYVALIDASAAASGESDIVVKDNVADALTIREAANAYLTVVTTDNSEAINAFKRTTTTDGVASGAARIVGGLANVRTAAGTSHTGSTDEAVLGSYSIPANTIKVGTVVTVNYCGRVTADNAATTLTARLRFGATTLTGTELVVTAAVDTSSGHIFNGRFELTGRAVPGAAAAIVGHGWFSDPGAAGTAMKNAILSTANFATNGALLLEVTGDWSAADANAVQLENFTVRIEG
jgi:uncharacterized protein (DUF433 family)